jgi:TaqI-like C-terminal specificity domain
VSFLKVDALPQDLEAEFVSNAQAMPRARLGSGSWQLETGPLAKLRDKIVKGKKTLGEVYGPPMRGIVTGLNDALVVDAASHERLVAQDPKSTDLPKPFLRGENIKRWRVEAEGLFLVNTPKGKVNIDGYPAIRDWLLPFRPELEKRATKQEWFELQQAQLAYHLSMSQPKVVWAHFQDEPSFTVDRSGALLNNKCFFLPSDDLYLLALLNSRCFWFQLTSMARIKRGGYVEAEAQYVGALPMPLVSSKMRGAVVRYSEQSTQAAMRRFEFQSAVRHRILDLAPSDRKKLSRKLEEWPDLDFVAFCAEVKRVFHAEIPVRKRAEWEEYLAESAAGVKRLTAEIKIAERKIDDIVYKLFDLTADEISLLEASVEWKQ